MCAKKKGALVNGKWSEFKGRQSLSNIRDKILRFSCDMLVFFYQLKAEKAVAEWLVEGTSKEGSLPECGHHFFPWPLTRPGHG